MHQIYFYLTEGCNLKCRHCWLDPADARGATLSVDHFEKAILEGKRLGLTGVKLTGGEPLMHPSILRLLEIVRREELDLTIETNGTLCTPSLAKEIARSPRVAVSVSLDSTDAATHDWIRGMPGAFLRALAAICNLAAAGIAPQIIMTLMEANQGDVDAMVRLAENAGAESVKFNIVQPSGRAALANQGARSPAIRNLINLGRYVDTQLAPRARVRLFFDLPPAFRPLSRIADEDGCGVCGILGILGVLPDGHYALCGIGRHVPELVFGSVENDSLEKIWHENPFLQALRKGLPERLEGVCGRCLMKAQCLGSCIAQNYLRSRSPWAPHWLCQEAANSGLFPKSRLTECAAFSG